MFVFLENILDLMFSSILYWIMLGTFQKVK